MTETVHFPCGCLKQYAGDGKRSRRRLKGWIRCEHGDCTVFDDSPKSCRD